MILLTALLVAQLTTYNMMQTVMPHDYAEEPASIEGSLLCPSGQVMIDGMRFACVEARKDARLDDRMLKWFERDMTSPTTMDLTDGFKAMAEMMVLRIANGPERTVALRKLLEAKDAAMRALLHPGG